MAIVLSPDVERQIEEAVKSGRYASADDFIRRSVERDREEQAWLAELMSREDIQRQVEEGVRALDRGDFTDYDEEGLKAFFEQIKREGRQELGLPPDAR
jgi:Arc/MetJ-type ribon-helix-helix transcriptional regulator